MVLTVTGIIVTTTWITVGMISETIAMVAAVTSTAADHIVPDQVA